MTKSVFQVCERIVDNKLILSAENTKLYLNAISFWSVRECLNVFSQRFSHFGPVNQGLMALVSLGLV